MGNFKSLRAMNYKTLVRKEDFSLCLSWHVRICAFMQYLQCLYIFVNICMPLCPVENDQTV